MHRYHLLSTQRNPDGSYDTPSIDEVLAAADDQSAALKAARFPLDSFTGTSTIAWLVDEGGKVVWSKEMLEAA